MSAQKHTQAQKHTSTKTQKHKNTQAHSNTKTHMRINTHKRVTQILAKGHNQNHKNIITSTKTLSRAQKHSYK